MYICYVNNAEFHEVLVKDSVEVYCRDFAKNRRDNRCVLCKHALY